ERDGETGDIVRRIYDDYRDVDGVKVPFLIRQVTETEDYPDNVVELRVQVVHLRPVREEMFAVPELAPTEPQADELLTMLDKARTEAEADRKSALAQVTHARMAYVSLHF